MSKGLPTTEFREECYDRHPSGCECERCTKCLGQEKAFWGRYRGNVAEMKATGTYDQHMDAIFDSVMRH